MYSKSVFRWFSRRDLTLNDYTTYFVRGDQRLGGGREPRELDRSHGTFGEKSDGGHRGTQVTVAEAQVGRVRRQPASGPVHGLPFQDGQHCPADRAHPVRVHGGGDARKTTIRAAVTARTADAQSGLKMTNESTLSPYSERSVGNCPGKSSVLGKKSVESKICNLQGLKIKIGFPEHEIMSFEMSCFSQT